MRMDIVITLNGSGKKETILKENKLLTNPYDRFKDYPSEEFDDEDAIYDLAKESNYDIKLFKKIAKEYGIEITITMTKKGEGGFFYTDKNGVIHKEELEDIFPEFRNIK